MAYTEPKAEFDPTSLEVILESLAPRIKRFSNLYRYSLDNLNGVERQFLFYTDLGRLQEELSQSEAGQTVVSKLGEILENRPFLKIEDAVCIGLGQFTRDSGWDGNVMAASGEDDEEEIGMHYDKAQMGQLAAFLSWLDVISE